MGLSRVSGWGGAWETQETDDEKDAGADDVQAADERERLDTAARVEAREEDDGCNQGRGGEADKIDWVDDAVAQEQQAIDERHSHARLARGWDSRGGEDVERLIAAIQFTFSPLSPMSYSTSPRLTLLK